MGKFFPRLLLPFCSMELMKENNLMESWALFSAEKKRVMKTTFQDASYAQPSKILKRLTSLRSQLNVYLYFIFQM